MGICIIENLFQPLAEISEENAVTYILITMLRQAIVTSPVNSEYFSPITRMNALGQKTAIMRRAPVWAESSAASFAREAIKPVLRRENRGIACVWIRTDIGDSNCATFNIAPMAAIFVVVPNALSVKKITWD